VLDFMGFAQKFGPVLSYIRIASEPAALNQVRIDQEQADALIGCDLIVSTSPKASRTYRAGHTRVALNTAEISTADFVLHRDANLKAAQRIDAIRDIVGADNMTMIAANELAAAFLGDTIYANVLMLGFAWQQGLVPVSGKALLRAIEINAVQVENNKKAFGLGRLAAVDPAQLQLPDQTQSVDESLEEMLQRRANFLADYQDRELSQKFLTLVERVRDAESRVMPSGSSELACAVARAYFKTLAYKDEYEVARLHVGGGFLNDVRKTFGKRVKIRFHLAPPLLGGSLDARGRPRKKEFGAWMIPAFRLLARMKKLRGTVFDVFSYSAERRMEKALVGEFEKTVDGLLGSLAADNVADAQAIVEMYLDIRGYGPVKMAAMAEMRPRIDTAVVEFLSDHRAAA